jgi:hypothetical protein
VTLTATGLTAEQLPNLTIINPESVREYAEKPQFNILNNGELSMSVKQVLIPKQVGEITLPPIQVNWWNTQTKAQQTSTVNGLSLTVEQGEAIHLASMPSLPTSVEPITVHNAGFWPYATGLFALLWVATLGFAWHHKKNIKPQDTLLPKAAKHASSDAFSALQQAFTEQDGVKLNYALQQWMLSIVIKEKEREKLEQAALILNESLYKNRDTIWDTKALQAEVEKIQKRQVSELKQPKATLAQL